MRKIALLAITGLTVVSSLIAGDLIKGDGSSFVLPINQSWAKAYYKATGKKVQYNGGGSGKGIKDATSRLVDFAAIDAPLTPRAQKKYNMLQFPAVVGATVLAYNLPYVPSEALKLTDKAIVAIADEKVKYWDNPMIGTVFTTLIAMVLSTPIAMGIAIFLSEIAPEFLIKPVGTAIELLAAIPSIHIRYVGTFLLCSNSSEYFWRFSTLTSECRSGSWCYDASIYGSYHKR